MIILKKPYLKSYEMKTRICCDFLKNDIKQTIWFETEKNNINLPNKVDCFLLSIVYFAIGKEENIVIDKNTSVSLNLYNELTKSIIPKLAQYLNKEEINIECRTVDEEVMGKNICCNINFSLEDFSNIASIETKSSKIDAFLYIDFNMTKNYDKQKLLNEKSKKIKKIKKFVEEYYYQYTIIDSNINALFKQSDMSTIFNYIAITSLLEDKFSKFYFQNLLNKDLFEKIFLKNQILIGNKSIYCITNFANKEKQILTAKKYKPSHRHIKEVYERKLSRRIKLRVRRIISGNKKTKTNKKQKETESKNINIGLVYLNVNNLGDLVIYDTTRYLIKKILKDINVSNYKFTNIDIGDKKSSNIIQNNKELKKISESNIPDSIKEGLKSKEYQFYLENTKKYLEGLDLIIFVGGGLIKYHLQNFHIFINDITEYAENNNIPVVINSVGIEGYDEKDERCIFLKKALNRNSVKYISTRDDIETLKNNYITNSNIKVDIVCDPALYTKETYNIKKNPISDTIGIGVIRSNIYKEYFVNIGETQLLELYNKIVLQLLKENKKFKLFTNGAMSDYKFILKLKEYMNMGEEFFEYVESRPTNTYDLVDIISNFKNILACRLHSGIIAYSLNIPSVSLVWNNKQIMFGKVTNQEENFIQKKDFDFNNIYRKLSEVNFKEVGKEYKESIYLSLKQILKQIINENE